MIKNLAVALLLLLSAAFARAQDYPKRPINLVIPLAPGDATDTSARAVADELSRELNVPIVAVNRPGAGSALGTDIVVKARNDGYTIVLTNNAALVFRSILDPANANYDPFRDLTPLALAMRSPSILTVRGDAPYRNLSELVEHAKKNPGSVRIGTMTGQLRSGAVRGIVISSKYPDFPEIPTLAELGYAQPLFDIWAAFFAPAGVPPEVTGALVPALERAIKAPGIAAKLRRLGMLLDYAPPDKLLADMREEHRRVSEIARQAGLVR